MHLTTFFHCSTRSKYVGCSAHDLLTIGAPLVALVASPRTSWFQVLLRPASIPKPSTSLRMVLLQDLLPSLLPLEPTLPTFTAQLPRPLLPPPILQWRTRRSTSLVQEPLRPTTQMATMTTGSSPQEKNQRRAGFLLRPSAKASVGISIRIRRTRGLTSSGCTLSASVTITAVPSTSSHPSTDASGMKWCPGSTCRSPTRTWSRLATS